jgi:hypothetical protein
MKDEMENQQTRRMKRENPEIEICPGITRRTVAHGKTMYQMMATLAAGSCMLRIHIRRSKSFTSWKGKCGSLLMVCRTSFYLAIRSISRAIFRMVWKRFCPHACSILSVRRAMITWRSTKKFATVRSNCSKGNS